MKQAEPSLRERAGRVYRRLLLLQGLFHPVPDGDIEPSEAADGPRELEAAVREVIDELTDHARILTTIPFPLSEWRPGDARDDERWRALTEVERREVLSLVSGYENLIAWAEEQTREDLELAALVEVGGAAVAGPATLSPQRVREAVDYLRAERARIRRFRQDMAFLNRRSSAN